MKSPVMIFAIAFVFVIAFCLTVTLPEQAEAFECCVLNPCASPCIGVPTLGKLNKGNCVLAEPGHACESIPACYCP